MSETLLTLHELGYGGMLGLLRAKRDGLICGVEYGLIKEHCHAELGEGRDWFRAHVWSA
jgi:hypothetical protein